jgi:hypothetical protein
MSSTHSLFNLPDALLVEIFSQWINLETLTLIDTATCSQTHRTELLRLFSCGEFQKHGDFEDDYVSLNDAEAVSWIVVRNIKCQVFVFEPHSSEERILKKNKMNLTNVTIATKTATALAFNSWDFSNYYHQNSLLASIIHNCSQLSQFVIDDCTGGDSMLLLLLPSVLNKLKLLKLSDCHDKITHNIIPHLTQNCQNLYDLHFSFKENEPSDKVTEDQIVPLLVANPLLEIVYLSLNTNMTNKLLTTIATHCPNINSLEVLTLTTDDFQSKFLQTFLSATKINTLQLYHSSETGDIKNFLSFDKHSERIWIQCCFNVEFLRSMFTYFPHNCACKSLVLNNCAIHQSDELFGQIVASMGSKCVVSCS